MKKLISTVIATLIIAAAFATTAPAKAAPTAPNASYYTTICCTPVGSCNTGVVGVNGEACWCNFNGYSYGGYAC